MSLDKDLLIQLYGESAAYHITGLRNQVTDLYDAGRSLCALFEWMADPEKRRPSLDEVWAAVRLFNGLVEWEPGGAWRKPDPIVPPVSP